MEEHVEILIERFVLCPETLSAESRAAVAALLETSPAAGAIAEFYRAYYHLLGNPSSRPSGSPPPFPPS